MMKQNRYAGDVGVRRFESPETSKPCKVNNHVRPVPFPGNIIHILSAPGAKLCH